MASTPEFLLLDSRGRFRPVPGATIEHMRANAWNVTVPRNDAVKKLLRAAVTPEALDDTLWLIDGVESVQAVGTAESADAVVVSILMP